MNVMVNDTRALLRMFEQTSYLDMYVRTGDYSVFMARAGGGPNPMTGAAAAPVAEMAQGHAAARQLTAPHVATLVWTAPAGDVVEQGATVARIALLDEEIALTADASGTIQAVLAVPGALIEFGEIILTMDG